MPFFPQLSQCATQSFDCMKYDHIGSQVIVLDDFVLLASVILPYDAFVTKEQQDREVIELFAFVGRAALIILRIPAS